MNKLVSFPFVRLLPSAIRKRVGAKLVAVIFLSIVILMSSLGFMSYKLSATIIKDKVAQAAHQTVIQAAQKLDLQLQLFQGISTQLAGDASLKSIVHQLKSSSSRVQTVQQINARLDSYRMNSPYIKGIYLVPADASVPEVELFSVDNDIHEPSVDTSSDWFQQSIRTSVSQVAWFDAKDGGYVSDTANPVFLMGRYLKTFDGVDRDYVLLFEIKLDALASNLTGITISENARTWIVNENNRVVQSEDERIGSVSGVQLGDKSGVAFLAHNGTRELVVHHPLGLVNWTVAESAPVSELTKETRKIIAYTLYLIVFSAVIALIIGYLIVRSVVRPLARIQRIMNDVENGDLRIRVRVKGEDEITRLGESINRMLEQVSTLIEKTNTAASEVISSSGILLGVSHETADSARDIAEATEEISQGAIQLASEAEKGTEVNVAVGEYTRQVMAYSARMFESVNDIKRVTHQGKNNMSQLIENTASMQSMMRRMNDRVGKLNYSTASIQKILSLLVQLTKQTTILSLNASIEAARAGTAGKGFAVVAEEIRKLAEQSKQSIEIADELLSTIQTEVGATVSVISEAFPIFTRQTESVEETDVIFRQVQAGMQEFEENIGCIGSVARELELSQMKLSESLNSVTSFSQQSSAGSEEVASLSKEQFAISEKLVTQSSQLEALSGKLKVVISRFRI